MIYIISDIKDDYYGKRDLVYASLSKEKIENKIKELEAIEQIRINLGKDLLEFWYNYLDQRKGMERDFVDEAKKKEEWWQELLIKYPSFVRGPNDCGVSVFAKSYMIEEVEEI